VDVPVELLIPDEPLVPDVPLVPEPLMPDEPLPVPEGAPALPAAPPDAPPEAAPPEPPPLCASANPVLPARRTAAINDIEWRVFCIANSWSGFPVGQPGEQGQVPGTQVWNPMTAQTNVHKSCGTVCANRQCEIARCESPSLNRQVQRV
jgi:hypothetical protein